MRTGIKLEFNEQVRILGVMIDVLKSGRTSGVALSPLVTQKTIAPVYISANISNCKNYNDIRIVDVSPAGLHVKESCNLKELL